MRILTCIVTILTFVQFMSCNGNKCKIDFESQKDLFSKIVNDFEKNQPPLPTPEYANEVHSIKLFPQHLHLDTDYPNLFLQIEFIEYYYLDNTMIFQSPSCGNGIDGSNMVIYSTLSMEELESKRTFTVIDQISENWYMAAN